MPLFSESSRFQETRSRFGRALSIPRFTGWRVEAGLSPSGRRPDEGRRAKYYSLTKTGRQQLGTETAGWKRLCDTISLVLRDRRVRDRNHEVGSWLTRRRWEWHMDAEFQFHLDSQINDYLKNGLSRKTCNCARSPRVRRARSGERGVPRRKTLAMGWTVCEMSATPVVPCGRAPDSPQRRS